MFTGTNLTDKFQCWSSSISLKILEVKTTLAVKQFKEKYPGCNYSESQYSDQYSKLVIEALGGNNNNDFENENKIIKRIAKEVVINKTKNVGNKTLI